MKKSKLSEHLDTLKNKVVVSRTPGGIIFWWMRKSVGFGMLTLKVKRGKLLVDDEYMDAKFCASVVEQAIREATGEKKKGKNEKGEKEQTN